MAGGTRRRWAIAGWASYDLANTIFSFNILTLVFPVYAVQELGVRDGVLAIGLSASMLAVALASPMAGAISDRVGRRMPFLVASTLCCVVATALLASVAVPLVVTVYAVANFFFQIGLVFYDALLPDVAGPDDVGRVGGIGVGLGYLGSFVGLGATVVLTTAMGMPTSTVFIATAVLFTFFAVPCFLLVQERQRPRQPLGLARAPAEAWTTLKEVAHQPGLRRFLLSRFIYADAANTAIAFMGIYAVTDGGFSDEAVRPLLGAGIAAAIVGGLLFGRLVDRLGPKAVLGGVLLLWIGTLTAGALTPGSSAPIAGFWFVAIGAGACLGGTWAADRPLMLALTPPEKVGAYYGVYGMIGRFAAVTGPLLWGLIVDVLGWGRPAAVGALALMVVAAFVVLHPLRITSEGRHG